MKVVIAGGGIAALTAARAVRDASPDAKIDIFTDEPHRFYLRPRLIQFLAGELEQEDLFVYSPQWYQDKGIELHLSTPVVRLDTAGRIVTLEGGEDISYDRLLLAMGSHSFRPPLEGIDEKGVLTLRSIADAVAIKTYAQECLSEGRREAVVIGGGLMGLECASALAALGLEVTVLQGGPWLLNRQIDAQGAAVLEGHLGRLGIRCLSGVIPEAILSRNGAAGVRLDGGRIVKGFLILCTAGVRANTDLAKAAGLSLGRGILVDSEMRTSADRVYAAGDVAEYDGEAWCIIPAAVNQARVAAANIVDPGSMVYRGTVPSTTLKVVGVDLTSIGIIDGQPEGLEELRKTDHARGVYRKVVLRDGRIVGAILLGSKERVPAMTSLIKEGTDVSFYSDRLLDDQFDLAEALA
jgi:nitrite reductase (NADH) large subunit